MATIADVKARKQAPTLTVPIILNADARQAVITAEDAVREAEAHDRTFGTKNAPGANASLERARTAAREHAVDFTFRAIGRKGYERLRDAHPATPGQQAEFKEAQVAAGIEKTNLRSLAFNSETFPPALIAAACVTPAMTEADAIDLWDSDEWSEAELADLLAAAQAINERHRRVELGKG